MDIYDHAYVNSTNDGRSLVEFTYRMSANEIEEFVKLRVSNNSLFSGKRNTSMGAWRAILKHMGLLHKMTYSQASKKWENLKKRYKELKYNPDGVKVSPEVWRYFTLMDDAMEGRLEASAPVLEAFTGSEDFPFRPKRLRVSMATNSPCTSTSGGPEIEVCLNGEEDEDALDDVNHDLDLTRDPTLHAMEYGMMEDPDRHVMERERQVMEREKQVMERERLVLYRERAALDREIAALDRDRASLERERAVIEREKAMMEKERAMVEKDREAVNRERSALERDRARLGRLPAPGGGTDDDSEDGGKTKDSGLVDRKEQFFNLFEKLIENF